MKFYNHPFVKDSETPEDSIFSSYPKLWHAKHDFAQALIFIDA